MSAPADDPLALAHAAERQAARSDRRAFAASPLSAFVKAMQQTMDEYTQMRADGVSREDACRGIEAVLRDAWPKRVTKFPPRCDECDDIGWAYHDCTHQLRCRIHAGEDRHPAWEHSYVTPCHCEKGDRFRPSAQAPSVAITEVGRTRKRAPTRWRRSGIGEEA